MKYSLDRILLCVVGALLALIVGGTVFAFATKTASFGKGLRKDDPTPESLASQFATQKKSAFTKIGQLRTATMPDADEKRAVVIIAPWLEYAGDDAPFYEELDAKLREIRAIITGYFMQYTKQDVLARGEIAVKHDLLSQINEQLVLGKVSAIYFNDYQFLD